VNRHVLLYGLLGGLLIALLKAIEYRFLVVEYSVEIYGGLVAGPAFRDITSFALNYLKIPPDPE